MIYLDLFFTFFKIGLTTFGGGYAMIPLAQAFMVEKGWLTIFEVTDFIAISEMTPGPFAINIATFCGISVAGIGGALAATLGVIMPSVIIILAIAIFFENVAEHRLVKGALAGLRPAVVGLIATAAYTIGKTAFFYERSAAVDLVSVAFFAAAFAAIKKLKINPIIAVVLCAVAGLIVF